MNKSSQTKYHSNKQKTQHTFIFKYYIYNSLISTFLAMTMYCIGVDKAWKPKTKGKKYNEGKQLLIRKKRIYESHATLQMEVRLLRGKVGRRWRGIILVKVTYPMLCYRIIRSTKFQSINHL